MEVASRADAVEIAVTDHGSGVPEAFRQRLFERFAQAETGPARMGMGLGLSIVSSLATSVGGAVRYEPNDPEGGLVPGDATALTWIVVAFLLTAVIYWAATYAQTYLTGWVGQRALQDLRIQLFAHLQTLSVGFYSRRQAGVLISRLTNDVQALDQLVSDGVVTLFGSSLTLIGTAGILLWLDVRLALLTFLIFPVLGIASLAFRIVSADAYRITREKIPNHADMMAFARELKVAGGTIVDTGFYPGGHNWKLWRPHIPHMLVWAGGGFRWAENGYRA